jgi:hypothetical protein
MPRRRTEKPAKRPPATAGGLLKLTLYLHADELRAVEELARKERCSKADAVRRAIRGYFRIED